MPMLKRKKGEKKSAQGVRSAMHEMKRGKLHSGSKTGPKVTNPKQAVAIGLSQARKSGEEADEKPAPKAKGKPKRESGAKAKKKHERSANRMKRNIGRK